MCRKNLIVLIFNLSIATHFYAQYHSPICIPLKTDIKEHELNGNVKRSVRNYNGRGFKETIISEYNRAGMLVFEKEVNNFSIESRTYEYDHFNREVRLESEYIDLSNGNIRRSVYTTLYSDNEKIEYEYDENNVLLEEHKTNYVFDDQGRILSETNFISEYNPNTQEKEKSYIRNRYIYKYDGAYLKSKIEYDKNNDSVCYEYDRLGNLIKTEQFYNGYCRYMNINVWNRDVKMKEIQYEYGKIRRIHTYDEQGRETEEEIYAQSNCNSENHIVTTITTRYDSSDKYSVHVFEEYVYYVQDPTTLIRTSECYTRWTECHRHNITRDQHGNITREDIYSSRVPDNIDFNALGGGGEQTTTTIEYEYF